LSGGEVGRTERNASTISSLSANSLSVRWRFFDEGRDSDNVGGGTGTAASLALAMSMDERGRGERLEGTKWEDIIAFDWGLGRRRLTSFLGLEGDTGDVDRRVGLEVGVRL
jgi:hypothetical protein